MNAFPEPTADERATLDLHVGSWAERTPVQRGICLGVLRGHDSLPKLGRYLGVPESALDAEMRPLWGCLLWDAGVIYLH